MTQSTMTPPAQALTITPINGRIGARVEGVQLSGALDPQIVAQIRAAVLRYKVVFLRYQTGSAQDIEGFSELFDKPLSHPISAAPDGSKYFYEMDFTTEFRADHWHTDFSFMPDFVDFGILHPVILPPQGGETVWSNTAAAYDELPVPLRSMADQLWAVHSSAIPMALSFPYPTPAELEMHRDYNAGVGRSTRHPVVRVHPETGERSLLLGNFVNYFEGFPRTPGNALYEMLHHYVTRPENTIRWHWRMGDIAIWDNRSSQHYGVKDFGAGPRTMRRISLGKSMPKGVDGTESSVVA